MAAKKKDRPLKGNGRDGVDYADFITGLCNGSIVATTLEETTVPDGTRVIPEKKVDGAGLPLPDGTVTVNQRRLTKLEYNDPNG